MHALGDLEVEARESTRRDGNGQGDEDDTENRDTDQTRDYRWQRRQKTVVRPATRIELSGRPHVKHGSPARP